MIKNHLILLFIFHSSIIIPFIHVCMCIYGQFFRVLNNRPNYVRFFVLSRSEHPSFFE